MPLFMMTPYEVALFVAQQMRNKRLSLNLSQKSLSEKSRVSLSVIKQFERTGKIAFESLLKLAFFLDSLEEFTTLFKPAPPESFKSLDDLIKESQVKKRKRGRK